MLLAAMMFPSRIVVGVILAQRRAESTRSAGLLQDPSPARRVWASMRADKSEFGRDADGRGSDLLRESSGGITSSADLGERNTAPALDRPAVPARDERQRRGAPASRRNPVARRRTRRQVFTIIDHVIDTKPGRGDSDFGAPGKAVDMIRAAARAASHKIRLNNFFDRARPAGRASSMSSRPELGIALARADPGLRRQPQPARSAGVGALALGHRLDRVASHVSGDPDPAGRSSR